MPFLQPSKEKFLEYDLAKMVASLGNPERLVVGLMSRLPMQAGFDPSTQSMREAWVVYEQLAQLYEIETVDPDADEIPAGLEVLVVVHPRGLGENMLYRLEQFVLGGGRLVAFLDPFAESDRGDPSDPMAQLQTGSSSTLGSLLDSWGVEFDPSRIVGDLQYGVGTSRTRHIGVISAPGEAFNGQDIVSADLEVVNFSSTGWLQAAEGASTHFEPLVQSSPNAAPIDASRLRFMADPSSLLEGFNPTGDRYALVARVTGPASAGLEPPEGMEQAHRAESVEGGINVLLFADTDMLTDPFWLQKQPFFGGQSLVSAFADNGTLAVNAVDNMLGNQDLISIRTRAVSGRPFERVDDIRVAAERSYRTTEERLQLELQETERRLGELQAAKGEGELTVISEEQQAEIQRFLDRKLEIRRELRQVQHDLRRDIDSLGTRLKLLNIVLLPAAVMGVALIYALRRRRREATARPGEVGAP